MPTHYTHATIAAALDYDPDTGALIWKRQYGKRIRPGDPAGSINKDGERVVTVFGQTYLAKHVAWLLAYGHWPTHPITFRALASAATPEAKAAARLDLRLSNLCIHAPTLVRNSRADYMRARRAKIALERAAATEAEARVIDGYPSIVWSKTNQHWVVHEDPVVHRRIAPTRKHDIIGTTRDRIEAVEMFNIFTDRCLYVLDHPVPKFTGPEATIATPKGHTLAEISAAICYNPDTGEFLSRLGKQAGTRIDRPKDHPHGPRVVPFRQDTYYARNLAWFLHHWRYPVPGEITYADPMCRDDASIANIITTEEAERREQANAEKRRR